MNWSSKWGEPVSVGKEWVEIKPTPKGLDKLEVLAGIDTTWHENGLEIRTIKVGNKNIQVIVVGDLGLDFCEPGEKDEGWNIYHLPTLACFSSAVPPIPCSYCIDNDSGKKFVQNCENCMNEGLDKPNEFHYDNQAMLNWMAKVQFTSDSKTAIMWKELARLTPSNYSDNGGTAKDIIKAWCLSVKVE